MSWSISIIGSPENVIKEISTYSISLTGQSKIEFDDVKENLIAIVAQNFTKDKSWHEPVIQLDATGSGCVKNGVQVQRECAVSIKRLYTKLV